MPHPEATPEGSEFDTYAANYDEALDKGLSASGESKEFFAQARVRWLERCLGGVRPKRILDFGCGTGSSTPYLLSLDAESRLKGVEVSAASLEVARREHGGPRADFQLIADFTPEGVFDLAFCNGVFHHIPLDQRAAAVVCVFASVRTGGLFSFWENNPWNPGTRYVMSRIPFDRDAITLSYPVAHRLLRGAGFEIVRTDFLFYFPKVLGFLRGWERFLTAVPLGAQYQVLCRKP